MPRPTIDIDLTPKELVYLIEALEYRASRHESMGRYKPQSAGPHDAAAAFMHELRKRLIKAGKGFETKVPA